MSRSRSRNRNRSHEPRPAEIVIIDTDPGPAEIAEIVIIDHATGIAEIVVIDSGPAEIVVIDPGHAEIVFIDDDSNSLDDDEPGPSDINTIFVNPWSLNCCWRAGAFFRAGEGWVNVQHFRTDQEAYDFAAWLGGVLISVFWDQFSGPPGGA